MVKKRTKAGRAALIASLRRQTGSEAEPTTSSRLRLGCKAVDDCLKSGLAVGALHEVEAADHRANPAALGFLLVLAHLAGAARCGPLIWPIERKQAAFGRPYGPGLKHFGLDPGRIVFLRCQHGTDALWAMEEGLRIGGIAAVVGTRPMHMDLTASRRLQLAAEATATPVFLLRTHEDQAASVAVTRWRVAPYSAVRDRHGFFSAPRWQVALDRVRGGRTGDWIMEWDHEALCLRLPAGLGSGALQESDSRSAA